MSVARNLDHLRTATLVENVEAREEALGIIIGMFSQKELEQLVMVLAVGALHGGDAARSLAGRMR